MKRTILFLLLVILFVPGFSQDQQTKSDTLRKNALNVFMDASDYVRKEIPFINYVRDIKDAGVYIISTSQSTGSGGTEYTFFLVGQHQFSGMKDTVSFVSPPDDTEDLIRQKEVKTLKMGLMRYVAKTPLSKFMNISFTEPLSETVTTDKWNSWVFSTSVYGYLEGEKSYKSTYLSGNASASRITEKLKVNLRFNYNYNNDRYDTGTDIIKSDNRSTSFNSLIVKSLTDHWSYGGSFSIGSSTYSNEKLICSVMPGLEYDIFPYSQSTRRQLRLLYKIGSTFADYQDSTIYDKTEEVLWLHSLSASYEVVEKWGSINMSLSYSNYLHDWSKNNLSLYGFLSLRIAKGLQVTFGGNISLIHDQLALVKGGATTEEVLLRRKELATQFQYFTSFGLTYTFGSIYNNVVNPRFGNNGGGGMSISFN
jgi:hypothetical protein